MTARLPEDSLHDADTPVRQGHAGRWVAALMGIALAGGVGAYLKTRNGGPPAEAGGAADARPVPVVLARVQERDVPVYLEGLGSVLPIATVTVKTLVDGRLDGVFFKEGQRVKKGELIAQIDPRPFTIALHQADATLARDNAQLRNARLNLDRYRELRKENLVPEQQLTDQQALADQNEATVKTDQAQIESARLQLDYAHIVSPIDGVTGVRLVDPGNIVHPSDPGGIVVITQLDPMAVLFTLPEDDLPRLSKAMGEGTLSVDAYNRDGTSKLATGNVTLIDNQINQTTATIRVKATFANPASALWPNEFVKVRAHLETKKHAIAIPVAAVQRGPQGAFVYSVGHDQTAALSPVEIDTIVGDVAIVSKGLAAGQDVVVDGQSQIKPGSKVAPRAPDKPASTADLAAPEVTRPAPSATASSRGQGSAPR